MTARAERVDLSIGLAVCDAGRGPRLALYDIAGETVVMLDDGPERLAERIADLASGSLPIMPRDASQRPAAEVRLLPPVAPGARVFCVAQNYAAHAQEVSGTGSPPVPVLFLKPPSAFVGAGDRIEIPPVTEFLDYEGEVAIFIGTTVRRADAAAAERAIAGYSLANDGTARDLQNVEIGGRTIVDWFSAKSLDRSSSLGPAIVPAAAIPDPTAIEFELAIDGKVLQHDVTGSMRHSPGELVSFISHRVALQPGDVVLTGTPAGVGKALGRPMLAGDVVTLAARELGTLVNPVVSSDR